MIGFEWSIDGSEQRYCPLSIARGSDKVVQFLLDSNESLEDGSISTQNFKAAAYRASETLLDGRTLRIRPIRPSDKQALEQGLEHLSAQSAYFRFFQRKTHFTAKELEYFTEVEFVNHVALVASVLNDGLEDPAGVGRYIVLDNATTAKVAEIAFAVEDTYHGLGIATFLLKHLTAIARENRIDYVQADVLTSNHNMLEVFENSGLPVEQHLQGEVIEVLLRLS
ncbi:MAG: GNAT family N-acetyltransferase [Gammaproteobacteria bacterium]|nr:GNAT family N-acetyltransferase [Gammaproteobacteria bacterium]